jgi:SpoVK/Ycf46/Vps4 family AAA+-type ATPase
MTTMPKFLKIGNKPGISGTTHDHHGLEDYKPLLGLWLIDLALTCNWIAKPPSGSLEHTFANDSFMTITGLPELGILLRDDDLDDCELEIDTDDVVRQTVKSKRRSHHLRTKAAESKVKSLLMDRRKILKNQGVRDELPLFANIYRLTRMMTLTEAESAVLSFAASLTCFPIFHNALSPNYTEVSDSTLTTILASLTGHMHDDIRKALRRDGMLQTSGLIRLDSDSDTDLENKIKLVRDLQGVMLENLIDDEELNRRVLCPSKPGTLSLDDFSHLAADIQLLQNYLTGAISQHEKGANILLYGAPGTGKTEFAKALAAKVGLSLFDISCTDEDGDPIAGEQRLLSLAFCQRALKTKPQVALLFDEIEDVLPGRQSNGFFGMMFAEKPKDKGGKAWINRALEDNPVPTFWITNDAAIDDAYLRRFDYALAFRIPPRKVRHRIAQDHLGQYAPNAAAVAAIAELDDLLPAQLERAARVARLCATTAPGQAWQNIEMTLQRSRALLGQTRKNLKAKTHTHYSLEFLNTDADIAAIIQGLRVHPQASFCLYGPSGTGKSQLARHIADELGKPILIKRASDLLDKYVGETEQRLAKMFEEALNEDAVLLLDEADSFLSDRSGASRQWEITQTNELLTQMESFEGIFIATTNWMDKIDMASLRRFNHKVKFDYLTADQRWGLFVQEYCRLGGTMEEARSVEDQVRRMEGLTPGDFAVVVRNQVSLCVNLTAFVAQLKQEIAVKSHGKGRLGFV